MSEDIRKWSDGRYTLMFDEHTFFVWDNENEKRMTALQTTKKLNEQQATTQRMKHSLNTIYKAFEKELPKDATILDLGAGTGRTYAYFSKRGYNYIGLDFSPEMKKEAFRIHGEFPYVLDDMMNVKKYFKYNSIDAVFAVYS